MNLSFQNFPCDNADVESLKSLREIKVKFNLLAIFYVSHAGKLLLISQNHQIIKS